MLVLSHSYTDLFKPHPHTTQHKNLNEMHPRGQDAELTLAEQTVFENEPLTGTVSSLTFFISRSFLLLTETGWQDLGE